MSSQKQAAISLKTILSEAYHVITSNPGHFAILSLMFLFPLSFSSLILNALQISASPENPNSQSLVVPILALITSLLSTFAGPAIIYSAFHAYYDVPLKIATSLKAILDSFFPILGTSTVSVAISILVSLAYGGLIFVVYCILSLFGFSMDGSKLITFASFAIALLIITFAYMGLIWCLTSVVVVIESKWGFAPLERSSRLIKGMRWKMLFLMILSFTFSFVLWSFGNRVAVKAVGRFTSLEFLLQMIVLAVLLTLATLYGMAVNVVVYIRCKEFHSEFERFDSKNTFGSSGGKYERVYSGVVEAV